MQKNNLININMMCETLFPAILRTGHPGIHAIGDAGDFWVVVMAPEKAGETEYGTMPYIVSKNDLSIKVFSVSSDDDWDLLEHATEVEVPEKYRAKYVE